ncbi:MAG: hypothetical protein QOJ98_537, partial [Acidobacteriota bacterium]|nr:hypothetical protein [Acidobacteriota bacterium]
MKLSKIWLVLALLIPVHAFPQVAPNWSVEESQPPLAQGGRTNSVAVNPLDRNLMLAASDSGGLFRSLDAGTTWRHLGGLPVVYTQSVAYLPADPAIVLVSAKADFKTVNGGGVWRSTDGGTTWGQVDLPVPDSNRLSAYGISAVGDDVVVGTSEGIFVSTDGGVHWEYSDPFGVSDSRVFTVLLTPGNPSRIYAGGPSGVRLNTLPLGAWDSPVTSIGGLWSMHAFGRSPLSASHAFVTTGHLLWRTENRGVNWTLISSAPQPAPPCAGTPFVKAALRSKGATPLFLDLYYGNACDLHRLYVRVFPGPDYSGTWQQLAVEHDVRDLALFGAVPVLVASNGGVHKTADGGLNWTYTGGGTGGYNALQITEVKGQFVRNPGTPNVSQLDLYFGTQDNNVWAMRFPGIIQGSQKSAGFYLDMGPTVQSEAESRITYVACGPCQPYRTDRDLANPVEVHHSAAAPIPNAAPVFVRQGQYLLNVPHGLDITLDPDMGVWQPFAVFLEPPVGLPRLAFAAVGDSAYAWQSYKDGAATKLMKIHHINGVGHITRPAMQNFGSLAVNRVMGDVAYPVYAEDSSVLPHVIAADIDKERMAVTWDSGDKWDEIPALTGLVRKNGTLLFAARLPDGFETMPLVTSISFHPDRPSHILIGTNEGGIYYTSDRGEHWGRINGSERVTSVTSFFWANLNSVWVSSFGRGLWLLRNRPIALPEAFDELCATCQVLSDDGGPAPFDASVLVYDGRILGVRRERGQLREVFVTTGSSFVFTGDPKDLQEDIVITESNGKQTFDPLPKPPKD